MFESQGAKERTFENAGFIDLKLNTFARYTRFLSIGQIAYFCTRPARMPAPSTCPDTIFPVFPGFSRLTRKPACATTGQKSKKAAPKGAAFL